MAFAGKSDKKENVTAAIAANIWMSHERGGRTALPDETLNFIVLDCLVSLASNMLCIPSRFSHSSDTMRVLRSVGRPVCKNLPGIKLCTFVWTLL